MSDRSPTFLVNAHSDPALVRITGRASHANSASLKQFLQGAIDDGKRRFVIDFADCDSMDSTFLGVLAGTAMRLRKLQPKGSLVLTRMGTRNAELVHNLGLHRLLSLDTSEEPLAELENCEDALKDNPAMDEITRARLVLAAHEDLCTAEASNNEKFKDVLQFLRETVGEN